MAISRAQFVHNLLESGLYSADEVQSLVDALPDSVKEDGEKLAREMYRRRWLTSYQTKRIYEGKGKKLTFGNYRVLDKLGEGGMGVVLKAEHSRMQRMVALKVLSPVAMKSKESVERFQREVQAAARLHHPNIVTAYDADEADGLHFLVMQYVKGRDLAGWVKANGPMTWDQALDCILQTARGLEYAHRLGVVHRDIKPANLLLDSDGVVRILDMGLARMEAIEGQADLTNTGQIMGTIDFMAPEQAMNPKGVDQRSDIYALGMTLWYLLTGRHAFEAPSMMGKLLAHRERPVPSLRAACPEAPDGLEAVFRKMVAKIPSRRYASLTPVIADLERCRASVSVTTAAGAGGGSEDSALSDFFREGTREVRTPTGEDTDTHGEDTWVSEPQPGLPAVSRGPSASWFLRVSIVVLLALIAVLLATR